MPYLGSQRTISPSVQVSNLARGVVTVPSSVNILGSGSFETIATYTFSGSESETTFSSIPSVYDNLWLIIEGRNSTSSNRPVSIQFNGDTTGGNYAQQQMYEEVGTQTKAYQNSSQTSISGFNFGGTGLTASYPTLYFAQIMGIQNSTHKNVFLRQQRITATSSESVQGWLHGVYQGSTSPITSIKVKMDFADNFVSGSKVHLYGLRGI
jgi:hypothetical protein